MVLELLTYATIALIIGIISLVFIFNYYNPNWKELPFITSGESDFFTPLDGYKLLYYNAVN